MIVLLILLFTLPLFCADNSPTYYIEAYCTRSNEQNLAKDYVINNTTDCINADNRFRYDIITTMPYNPPFSSFTATMFYIGAHFSYPLNKRNKADAIYNFLKSNLNTWVSQKRIAWIRISKFDCSHLNPAGQCRPDVPVIIYER